MWRDPCNGIKSKLIWNVINVLLDQYSAHVIRFCYTRNKKIMDYRCMPWKIKMVYHYIVRYWKNGALHAWFVISQIQISIVLICRSNPWWRHQMEHFLRYWPFVWGIHRSPVNSPYKSQWRGALVCYLICAWTNGWVNNRNAGDLRHHRAHYYVTVIPFYIEGIAKVQG